MSEIIWRENLPTINVKTHRLNFDILSDEEEASAVEFLGKNWQDRAWEWLQEDWWRQAEEIAQEIFGPKAEVFASGRMGGWLQVEGTGLDQAILEFLTDPPNEAFEDEAEQRVLLEKWVTFRERIRAHLKDAPEMYKQLVLAQTQEKRDEMEENLRQAETDRQALVQDLVSVVYEHLELTLPRTLTEIFVTNMNKVLDKHLGGPT